MLVYVHTTRQTGAYLSSRPFVRNVSTILDKKKYSDSLNLPSTSFPLRPDHSKPSGHEPSQSLYAWQNSSRTSTARKFILHDGPPYANGDLHMGHALNKILKDIIVRRKILEGYQVQFVPGWDCHGLPIELKALQKYQGSKATSNATETSREEGPTKVRQIARTLAEETVGIQSRQFQNMAICADWDQPYRTLDFTYEARQLEVFAKMVSTGLIYRADKPVYWSPSSRSALAESELEYSNDHISHSAYVAYQVTRYPTEFEHSHQVSNLHLLIWTTTPWTLPANKAIAVNPQMDYTILELDNGLKHVIVALELADNAIGLFDESLTARRTDLIFPGSQLLGMVYCDVLGVEGDRKVIGADYVSAESGTGLVHTAPGHGQEDYQICKQLVPPIPPFSPVDGLGNYTADVGIPDLEGLNVQNEGARAVVKMLKESGALIAMQKYKHKYPYDWRTKKPIIVRSTPQFFADLSSIKGDALRAIEKIAMIPASGRPRLTSFVQSRDEWCISRQRSWGVPIPALYNEDGNLLMDQESIEHIISVLEKRGMDAWFSDDEQPDNWVDWVPPSKRDGTKWIRGRETLDVWFDSGCSWTTLQPEGHLSFTAPVVADLYLEGSDQHRGWFQSSLLTSIATRGIAPYKQVLTHGFLLDDKGRKMSKSIGNTVDPLLVINGREASVPSEVDGTITDKKKRKQLERLAKEEAAEIKALGADTLRLWVAQSDYTSDVSVSSAILSHVSESLRKYRTTLRYLIGNLQDFRPASGPDTEYAYQSTDQYAVCMSRKFRHEAEQHFEAYTFNKIVASANQYTNTFLSAFYFDTLKDRLYADGKDSSSRNAAQRALYNLLKDYMLVLAPICPVLISEVWHHLPTALKGQAKNIYETNWFDEQEAFSSYHQDILERWATTMQIRDRVNKQLDTARLAKVISSSLQADIEITLKAGEELAVSDSELANLMIVSRVELRRGDATEVVVKRAIGHKCPRCWVHVSKTEDALCHRCESVMRAQH